LLRAFGGEKAYALASKGDVVPVKRQADLFAGQCSLFAMRYDFDLSLLIEEGLLAGIDYDKIRSNILDTDIFSGTQHNIVMPFGPIELPGRLEQLKELSNDITLSWIYYNAYHDLQENTATISDAAALFDRFDSK
jgi:hypothetical protein